MYIVTGGAGFIGSQVAKHLNDNGIDQILIVDRLESDEKYKNLIGLDFEDYVDKEAFIKLLTQGKFTKKVKAIIHMGACSATTELDASYLMENNYQYSKALAVWSMENNARYIYASSAATYGDGEQGYSDEAKLRTLKPLNPYGYSKYAFDLWVEKHGLLDKTVGLKFFNVYGPGEDHKDDMRSVVNKAFDQITESGKVKLFRSHKPKFEDGMQLRDFIYVKDAVNVIQFFLSNPKKNGIFNVGTGQARAFKDLVTATFNAMDIETNIEYIDMPNQLRDKYQYYTQAEMNKLNQAGYSAPFQSLEEGVSDYVKNYLMKR